MEMTPRERLLASIYGKPVDHIPFSPFLAYYFDFLPEQIRAKGELSYLQEMGADPLLRGGICAYEIRSHSCSLTQAVQGNKRYETIHTPKGDLFSEYTYVKQANTWFLTNILCPAPSSLQLQSLILKILKSSKKSKRRMNRSINSAKTACILHC